MAKHDIEDISKEIQTIIDDAKNEISDLDSELSSLWAEQERIANDPAQYARKGNEDAYKNARLHAEFICDRIGILEARKDSLETQPLVDSEEYGKIMEAIQAAYATEKKKCAEAFLKAASAMSNAVEALENVRTSCNVQIYKTNRSLYWTETAKIGTGEKVRDIPAYGEIEPSKMSAAWIDLNQGGSLDEAEALAKQPEPVQMEGGVENGETFK